MFTLKSIPPELVGHISEFLSLPDCLSWKLVSKHYNNTLSLFNTRFEVKCLYRLAEVIDDIDAYCENEHKRERFFTDWMEEIKNRPFQLEPLHSTNGKKRQDEDQFNNDLEAGLWYQFYTLMGQLDKGRKWIKKNNPEWFKKWTFPVGTNVDALAAIYLDHSRRYESCSAYSAFLKIYKHTFKKKAKENWKELTKEQQKLFFAVKDKVDHVVAGRYYNQEELFSDIKLYNDEEKLELEYDMKLLNVLTKFHSIKHGYDIECYGEEDFKYMGIDEEYLNEINLVTNEDLNRILNEPFSNSDCFYLLYNFGTWRTGGVRMLPLFAKQRHFTTCRDILDNVWAFALDGYRNVDKFTFYGWKNEIPIFEIKEIDNFST